MLPLGEGGVEDGQPLVGRAQAPLGEEGPELFARGGAAHAADCRARARAVSRDGWLGGAAGESYAPGLEKSSVGPITLGRGVRLVPVAARRAALLP